MWYIYFRRFDMIVALNFFLYFIVQIKLFAIRNHTPFIFYGGFCMYSFLFAYACIHMRVYSFNMSVYICLCFNAVHVSLGELFHVVHNEIRPTPCSLLSGFYLSNRLVQVISFLWRLVPRGSAQSTSTTLCRWERERRRQVKTNKKKGKIRENNNNDNESYTHQTPFDICRFLN